MAILHALRVQTGHGLPVPAQPAIAIALPPLVLSLSERRALGASLRRDGYEIGLLILILTYCIIIILLMNPYQMPIHGFCLIL